MASFVFDKTTAKIFSKAFSFDIHYDADKEGKKNARIDVPEFSLGGLQWKLVVRPNANDDTFPYGIWMELNEECRRALAHGYEVQLQLERVLTIDTGTTSEKQLWKNSISSSGSCRMMSFNSTAAHYEMTISIMTEDIHPYRLQFVDEAVAKTKRSDCKVVLEDDEDKIIFVHKTVLALNSAFFDILFYGEFKEKDQDAVKLCDVKQEDFLEYLYCVYMPSRPLVFKRLDVLLRLADRFQNDELLNAIEGFLREMKVWTSEQKHQALEWTDRYRMPTVFAQIVESLDKTELGSLDEKKCSNFYQMNNQVLMKRLIETCASF